MADHNLPTSGGQESSIQTNSEPKKRVLTRRNFIRAGAVVGAGLVASNYVKPDFQSIKVPRAFAQTSPIPPTTEGRLSIEFRPDNVGQVYTGTGSYTFPTPTVPVDPSYDGSAGPVLCNVSDNDPVTVESWACTVTVLEGASFLDPQNSSGVLVPTSFPMLTAGPPDACYPFQVTFQLGSNWTNATNPKIKVRIIATATSVGGQVVSSNGNGLTLTLAKDSADL